MLEKVKKFIKKNWKWIIVIIGAIVGATLLKRKITAIIGKVGKNKQVNFILDGSDDTVIHVNDGEKFIPVKLPIDKKGKQIKSKNVKAAGLSKSATGENKVVVEIKHEVTNRRNVGPRIDDSAGSRLNR